MYLLAHFWRKILGIELSSCNKFITKQWTAKLFPWISCEKHCHLLVPKMSHRTSAAWCMPLLYEVFRAALRDVTGRCSSITTTVSRQMCCQVSLRGWFCHTFETHHVSKGGRCWRPWPRVTFLLFTSPPQHASGLSSCVARHAFFAGNYWIIIQRNRAWNIKALMLECTEYIIPKLVNVS